ncbi:hypothetical protein [Paraburkholderia graminis]|uniref:Uncharacterized protein n=1 Tax=Paraburkholderia graminis TaxID=60548 RepID=A0ABD5CB96_9BURK|nr:hypothetical protein [Paraburkholderia graminis]MDR6202525.1 hypothetical protein [Paraburkholderia graminis]
MNAAVQPAQSGGFICRDGRCLTLYGERDANLPAGLYLGLFHGRDAADADMDDWGFAGPVIGPLNYVHTTYASEVKLRFIDGRRAALYFPDTGDITNLTTGERTPCPEAVLSIAQDLLVFDGRYFGDWTVFYHKEQVQ